MTVGEGWLWEYIGRVSCETFDEVVDYSFSWKQKSGVLRVNGDVQRKRGF